MMHQSTSQSGTARTVRGRGSPLPHCTAASTLLASSGLISDSSCCPTLWPRNTDTVQTIDSRTKRFDECDCLQRGPARSTSPDEPEPSTAPTHLADQRRVRAGQFATLLHLGPALPKPKQPPILGRSAGSDSGGIGGRLSFTKLAKCTRPRSVDGRCTQYVRRYTRLSWQSRSRH